MLSWWRTENGERWKVLSINLQLRSYDHLREGKSRLGSVCKYTVIPYRLLLDAWFAVIRWSDPSPAPSEIKGYTRFCRKNQTLDREVLLSCSKVKNTC